MSGYHNNSIFWVEIDKISPNSFQPRREFDPRALEDLADSIRQYGVLQPLVVTRKEEQTENGGLSVSYELIAGERRLRASAIAGLQQVPVIIRKETDDKVRLELAIIENLQREDLNSIDRALAFEQLYKQFNLTHAQIGKKMGKSRVYVSNTLRLLSLPDDIKQGLMDSRITEGHTRPLLMLSDKPEEQSTLFKEIILKQMSVRESEKIARSIAQDKIRKKKFVIDPRIRNFEKRLSENLGTRVQIEPRENGGKITIDYFSVKDLETILSSIKKLDTTATESMLDRFVHEQKTESKEVLTKSNPIDFISGEINTRDEDIEYTQEKTFSQVEEDNESLHLEKKLLTEFEHNTEEEIVEYKKPLEKFSHHENEEITKYKETGEEIVDYQKNKNYEHRESQKEDSHLNQFENKTLQGREQSYQDQSNQFITQNQQNLQQNQDFLQVQQAQRQQSDQYYNYGEQNQNYITDTPQYRENHTQYQQVQKKSFFGRLFG